MTKDFYKTETFDKEHIHFGGIIYPSDFNASYEYYDQNESSIAKRIMADWKFDQQCKKNAMNTAKHKEYKKGTK